MPAYTLKSADNSSVEFMTFTVKQFGGMTITNTEPTVLNIETDEGTAQRFSRIYKSEFNMQEAGVVSAQPTTPRYYRPGMHRKP